jgi:hypothetical protein
MFEAAKAWIQLVDTEFDESMLILELFGTVKALPTVLK